MTTASDNLFKPSHATRANSRGAHMFGAGGNAAPITDFCAGRPAGREKRLLVLHARIQYPQGIVYEAQTALFRYERVRFSHADRRDLLFL